MLIGSSQLAIPLISSEVHAAHSPWLQTVDGRVHDHPEVPDRPRVIREALEAQGLAMRVPPTVHADEAIDAVHDANYHRFFREACVDIAPGTTVVPSAVSLDHRALDNADLAVQIGHYAFGQDAPLMHATYRAAREACDIALTGATLVRDGCSQVFALCRPPGHHAERSRMGGFCYLNNAVIAAHALSQGGRVALLDLDYHHGNGSQHLTFDRADIFYVSLHADPSFAYPGFSGQTAEIGTGDGTGCNLNITLGPHTQIDRYLGAMDQACEAIKAFDPSVLVVSIGFDTHREDPIAIFGLVSEDFGRLADRIAMLGVPSLHVLEGGYALHRLGESAVAYVQGLGTAAST